MEGAGWEDKDPEILHIRVRGKDPKRWSELQQKFLNAMSRLLDSVVDDEGHTARDEVATVSRKALGALKSLLDKPGVDNELKLAQVEKTLAEAERARADAGKLDAEAEAQRFDIVQKKFELLMKYRRVLFVNDSDDPTALFAEMPDALLEPPPEETGWTGSPHHDENEEREGDAAS